MKIEKGLAEYSKFHIGIIVIGIVNLVRKGFEGIVMIYIFDDLLIIKTMP